MHGESGLALKWPSYPKEERGRSSRGKWSTWKKTWMIFIDQWMNQQWVWITSWRQIISGWWRTSSSSKRHLLVSHSRASGGHLTNPSFWVPRAKKVKIWIALDLWLHFLPWERMFHDKTLILSSFTCASLFCLQRPLSSALGRWLISSSHLMLQSLTVMFNALMLTWPRTGLCRCQETWAGCRCRRQAGWWAGRRELPS